MDTGVPTEETPARAAWLAWGLAVLFLLPAVVFLFSWYRPYLPEALSHPAVDLLLTLLAVAALPLLIWLRAGRVHRRRWRWAGLAVVGALLGLAHPAGALVGTGLPTLAYAVTGLANHTRRTPQRDVRTSWALAIVGAPLAFLVWWLAFWASYISDYRLGPPPFVSVRPAYVISLRADLSPLSPERRRETLIVSLKVMLLRLKEYSPGVVSTAAGDDTLTIGLFRVRNLEETAALVSSQGILEVVDTGESPVAAGSRLAVPHRTVVSGRNLNLRTTSDWRYGQWAMDAKGQLGQRVADAESRLDQSGYPVLELGFDSEGTKLLRDYTSANTGKYAALAMDNVSIFSPRVQAPILDGRVMVNGLSLEQARLIVLKLKYGALAAPFAVVSAKPVTPP